MKTVYIKILKDCTNTGGFGVEGYKIKLTTSFGSCLAFINMRNVVTTETSSYLHGLFDNAPFKAEFVDKVNISIQKAFKGWKPTLSRVEVDL